MHDNKIYYVSQDYADKKLLELNERDDMFTVVLDGTKIKDWNDYIRVMTKEFRFPKFEARNYDGYADYMTDLMWIDKDAFSIFILDYDEFMKNDISTKKLVMDIFLTEILFWWSEDVEVHCMGGKSKEFNIYLVNNYSSNRH